MKKSLYLAILFWFLLAAFSLMELLDPTLLSKSWYYISTGIILVASIFSWMLADAKEVGFRVKPWLKVGVVAVSAFFIPVYLVKAKGWKRAFLSFLKFIAFLVVFVVYNIGLEYVIDSNTV